MKIQEYSHLNILLNIPEFLEKNFHIKKKKSVFTRMKVFVCDLEVTILLKHYSTKMNKLISITVFFMCK